MGVSNAWGATYPLTVNYPYVYLDNSSLKWDGCNVVVGHDSYSYGYLMTKIENTNLFYKEIPTNWTDAKGIVFVKGTTEWGEYKNQSLYDRTNSKTRTGYKWDNEYESMDYHKTYYCTSSGSTSLTISYKENGYPGIPTFNATQAAQLRNDISSSYTTVNGTWPTTLKLQGTYLSGNGTSARSEISGTASSDDESNRVYGAVVTGKITHTYNTITGNYIFEGWGTGDAPLTTNTTYEYNITENTTVYAFFTKAYTVTFGKIGESGSSTVSATATANSTPKSISSGTKVAAGSTINLTANPATGYQVEGWYSDADCTQQLQKGGNKYNAGVLSAAKTVYVKFEELSANTVYLKLTGNWKSAAARYAVYVYNNTENKWIDMEVVGCSDDYYKVNIPARYTNIIFGRMDPKQSENSFDYDTKKVIWNQTTHYNIQDNVNKCFTIGEDQWGNSKNNATGTWDTYNPTITLTLKSSSNGTYKITYEGKTYESSLTENVVIRDLPLDAEIIISESATPNTGYKLLKRYIKLGTNEKVEAKTNTPYTLCGSTTISANFVTILPHTVYLNITNHKWSNDGAKLAIYVFDETDQEGQGTWIALEPVEGYSNYYTATIPAGESNFNFVRLKTTGKEGYVATNEGLNWDNKWNQTGNLAIPVTRYSTFKLTSFGTAVDDATGVWETGAAFSGDYRLAYVEQVVDKGEGVDNWKTVINNTDPSHTPDDIIRKRANGRDTISLFINVNGDNPEIILQQYRNVDGINKWVDIEAHMITGPLKAGAGMAMINGRRNASPDSDIDNFVYDDGIAAINESGVWNFVIVQDAEGNASLRLKENEQDVTHKYTGNYYIRTDNAAGGWNTYTHSDNIMKPSTNPESGYSHYYCKWVEKAQKPNVKFIVATDYSINVSKKFAQDDYTSTDGNLVENANVRWSWDEKTGVAARAYIQGAYNGQDRLNNIVLDYTTNGTTPANKTLDDSGDWIYTTDVTVNSGATLESLTAAYPSGTIDGVSQQTQPFITGPITILTGMSGENYTVRVTYDFKNNKATTFLLPGTTEVSTAVDVMIERVDQENTKAVQSTITAVNDQFTVCGVMSFTKDHLTNKGLHNDLRQFYWISFPFYVNLEDVYGFGVYGKHWILETYNGARRAQDGLWLDSPSFWEYILDPKGVTLEANKGYLLCLDSELLSGTSDVFTNTNKVSLYFPATTPTTTPINTDYTTQVQIPPHVREDTRANRHIYDSNWNLIGVPSYANHTQTTNTENLQYFYDYQYDNETGKMIYAPKSTNNSTNEFQSMYAYFVQWGGTLNWSTFSGDNNTPRELAAKRNAAYEAQEHNLRLELQQDYKALDQTFVDMQEDGVTAAFDLNKDMTKILNAGANIYTLAGEENIQLAGNALPIANTTIPVGVQIAKAGEYTFAMPDGTDGITVELIDYETNTRTNLLLSDYTVNLPAGTCETRFALSVKIDKTATSVENITEVEGANGEGVKKYIIDGKLFLQKDNTLYDAQGHIVR